MQEESAEKIVPREIARDLVRIMMIREGVEAQITRETPLEDLSIDPENLIQEAEEALNGADLNVGDNLPQAFGEFEDIILSFFSKKSSHVEPDEPGSFAASAS